MLVSTSRQVMKGSMAALAFCHSRSVVHRALSGSALLLSTYKLDVAAEAQARRPNPSIASLSLPLSPL